MLLVVFARRPTTPRAQRESESERCASDERTRRMTSESSVSFCSTAPPLHLSLLSLDYRFPPLLARERKGISGKRGQSMGARHARWCERTRRRGYLQRIVAGAGEGASFDQRAKRRALCVRQRSVDLQQPLEPPAQDVRVIWRVGGTCE